MIKNFIIKGSTQLPIFYVGMRTSGASTTRNGCDSFEQGIFTPNSFMFSDANNEKRGILLLVKVGQILNRAVNKMCKTFVLVSCHISNISVILPFTKKRTLQYGTILSDFTPHYTVLPSTQNWRFGCWAKTLLSV